MFIISNLLDSYFRSKLKNKQFRKQCYQEAIDHQLRTGKLKIILLRNLNKVMSEQSAYHDEFCELLNGKDFQQVFWESDLGYLWYQGNLNGQNIYFKRAISDIESKNHTSLLDVGCGWGEFPDKVSKMQVIKKVSGIDISESIIEKAKNIHPNSKVHFEKKDINDVAEKFDLITLFGSTDYIMPQDIYAVLEKTIQLANKQVLIVNSLRKIPFEIAAKLERSEEIKRYDIGYVHPLKNDLEKLKTKYAFNYTCEKAGQDSLLVSIDIK